MPLLTASVAITRKGSPTENALLELWRLPDGRRGAWYRGLVFPLRDDGSIDVLDVAHPPAECIPLTHSTGPARWVLSAEGADSYVYVAGTAHDLHQTEAELEQAGVSVLRSGPNLSQEPADWFIRCEGSLDGDVLHRLSVPCEMQQAPDSVISGQDRTTTLRLRLMAEALEVSEASRRRLQELLATAQSRAQPDPDIVQALEQAAAELTAERSRRTQLEAELEQLGRARPSPPHPKTARPAQELATVVATLLPRLEFLPGSLEFMVNELPSRKGVFEKLASIERTSKDWPPGWKRLRAQDAWWECHFSTGQDDQGRIYARPIEGGRRLQVLVSHKQDQARDLRRIS